MGKSSRFARLGIFSLGDKFMPGSTLLKTALSLLSLPRHHGHDDVLGSHEGKLGRDPILDDLETIFIISFRPKSFRVSLKKIYFKSFYKPSIFFKKRSRQRIVVYSTTPAGKSKKKHNCCSLRCN
jgi:hypothetical protein